jgi:hypothetical protein
MKVQHPTFPDVVYEVTNPEPWFAQGWVEYSEPQAPEAAASRPRRSRRRKPAGDTTGTPAGDMDVATATSDDQEVKEASDGE